MCLSIFCVSLVGDVSFAVNNAAGNKSNLIGNWILLIKIEIQMWIDERECELINQVQVNKRQISAGLYYPFVYINGCWVTRLM